MGNKYKQRWLYEERRINSILEALSNGQDWTIYLTAHDSHSFKTLDCLYDGKVPKLGNCLAPKDLRGIHLKNIDAIARMNFSETCFDFAIIEDSDFKNTHFNGSSFMNAMLSKISFEGATFNQCNFKNAVLRKVSFGAAKLNLCDFSGSIIDDCIFISSIVTDLKYKIEPWYGFFCRAVRVIPWTQVTNIHSLNKEDMKGVDDDFLDFLYEQKKIDRIKRLKIFSYLYYLFTNYGLSFGRLAFWIIFGWIISGSFFWFIREVGT